MALKIASNRSTAPWGMSTHAATAPPSDLGTPIPTQTALVDETLDHHVDLGTTVTATWADPPGYTVARISGATPPGTAPNPNGQYSTITLYSSSSNPVSLYGSSSFRRRISTIRGNLGIRA